VEEKGNGFTGILLDFFDFYPPDLLFTTVQLAEYAIIPTI